MALVTYHGPHLEPALAFPVIDGDGELRPWPIRGRSTRNEGCCFPREIPRRVPAVVAVWLAAARRREGPWFEVRLERGEWAPLRKRLAALVEPPPRPLHIIGGARARRRAMRLWRKRCAEPMVKARHALLLTSPRLVESFLGGCRSPISIENECGDRFVSDPLFG